MEDGLTMEPIITVASPHDSITFTGTDVPAGWIYDNDTLDGWYKLPGIDVKLNKRPNAHGEYDPSQLFAQGARFPIIGQYYGTSPEDATAARNRLVGLYADGLPVRVTVADSEATTSRAAYVIAAEPEWMPDAHFTFTIDFAAPDPRRYADAVETASGLPSASSGLVWPLGSGSAFWDWGTPGDDGRVTFVNRGNATTYPIIEVGDGGTLPDGFYVTEVETGRELRYVGSTLGQAVTLDSRTTRARIGTGDVTRYLARREWFEVPPGEARSYQFASLGAVVGAPELRLITADAYL